MEKQYELLKYKSRRYIQRSDNYSRSTTLVGQSSKDNIGVTSGRKNRFQISGRKTPQHPRKSTPNIGQLWGGSDALTKKKMQRPHLMNHLKTPGWLKTISKSIKIISLLNQQRKHRPNFFVHTKSLPQIQMEQKGQDPLFVDEVSSVHTEETEQIISNIEKKTLFKSPIIWSLEMMIYPRKQRLHQKIYLKIVFL